MRYSFQLPAFSFQRLRKIIAASGAFFLTPLVVFAATPRTFAELIYQIVGIINLLIPLLVSVALIVFFWGIFKYITAAGNSEDHEQGRRIIIWGIIALFVMISLWGIIRILQNTFLQGATASTIPSSYPHEHVAPLGFSATVES